MVKPLRSKDGRFAGSIGAGKKRIPTSATNHPGLVPLSRNGSLAADLAALQAGHQLVLNTRNRFLSPEAQEIISAKVDLVYASLVREQPWVGRSSHGRLLASWVWEMNYSEQDGNIVNPETLAAWGRATLTEDSEKLLELTMVYSDEDIANHLGLFLNPHVRSHHFVALLERTDDDPTYSELIASHPAADEDVLTDLYETDIQGVREAIARRDDLSPAWQLVLAEDEHYVVREAFRQNLTVSRKLKTMSALIEKELTR